MLRLILISLLAAALIGTFVATGTGAAPSQPQDPPAAVEDADDKGDRDEPADRGRFEPGDDDPEERDGGDARESEDREREDADERGGDIYEPGDDDPEER
jgi:hypothetical protein